MPVLQAIVGIEVVPDDEASRRLARYWTRRFVWHFFAGWGELSNKVLRGSGQLSLEPPVGAGLVPGSCQQGLAC